MITRTHCIVLVALAALFAAFACADPATLAIGRPNPIVIPTGNVIDPSAVTGGDSAQCTITLSGTVEGEDQVVNLETDHPEVYSDFPSSVVVPVGYDSVTFTLNTVSVSGSVQTTVTASCNGGQAQGTLTVNP